MMDFYQIMASGIQFPSKHTFAKKIIGATAPGADRRIVSSTYNYPRNLRDMMTWLTYFMEEQRVYSRKVVSSLASSGEDALPTNDRFITSVNGLIDIRKKGTHSFAVSGDDGVVFMCNGQAVGRYYGSGGTTGVITFDEPGLYDFTLIQQEYGGWQSYSVTMREPDGSGHIDIAEGRLFRYTGSIMSGLRGVRGPTNRAEYPSTEDWDTIEDYMRSHKYADIVTNFIFLDNYAYRFYDRGNYWGYTYDGYIRFPEDGEWELGTYADNAMTVMIDGKRIEPNPPSTWDRTIHAMKKTVVARANHLHKVRISALEITGGEMFLFGIRKKGTNTWRTDLTGLVYHDA